MAHLTTAQLAAQQWERYLGFVGYWHGSWHRFSAGGNGVLTPATPFRCLCAPKLAEDGRSVQQFNYYAPGVVPVGGKSTGREKDGLLEVDFGVYNEDSCRHPFGPHSLATYFDDCAVIAPHQVSAWPPKMFAVEFLLLRSGLRARRRLVAIWSMPKSSEEGTSENSFLQLSSITVVAEHEGDTAGDMYEAAPMVSSAASSQMAASAADGREISNENITWSVNTGHWETVEGVEDVAVRLPRQLTPEILLTGQPAIGIAWRRSEDEVLRHGVAYDHDGNMAQVVREIVSSSAAVS